MLLKRLFVSTGLDSTIAKLVHNTALKRLIPSPAYYSNQQRTITRAGVKYQVQPHDLTQWLLFSGNTDNHVQAAIKHACPTGVILDIGANIGHFSLPVARSLKRRIIAFEPNPAIFKRLQNNLSLNPSLIPFVTLYPYGIGEKNEHKLLAMPTRNSGAGTLVENYDHEPHNNFTVGIKPLDELINEPVAFIKIDVEGFEYFVLQGAERILREYRPPIYFETNSLQPYQQSIFEKLKTYGYSLLLEQGNFFLPFDQKINLEGVHNVLAIATTSDILPSNA